MKVIFSIKPKYVTKILDGTKRYEYRRRIFSRDDVDTIVIYSTSPVSAIVGEVAVKSIIGDSPKSLWRETHQYGGIVESDFFEYFSGTSFAYAIELGEVKHFKRPVSFEEYGIHIKRPPQSFAYVDGR